MNHTILAVSICSVCVWGGGGFIQLKRRQFTSGTRLTITQKRNITHTQKKSVFLFLFFSFSVCDQLSNNMKRRRLFLGSFFLFFSSYLFFFIFCCFSIESFCVPLEHNRHSSLTCSLPALLFFT